MDLEMLKQQLKQSILPGCVIHNKPVISLCLLRSCSNSFIAECEKCILIHPEHKESDKNSQMQEYFQSLEKFQSSPEQKNDINAQNFKIIKIAKEFIDISQQCKEISNILINFTQENSNENQLENVIKQILSNIIGSSQIKPEEEAYQNLQNQLQKLKEYSYIDENQQLFYTINNYINEQYKDLQNQLKKNIDNISQQLTETTNLFKGVFFSFNGFIDSSLLLCAQDQEIFFEWFQKEIKLKLIYRGTRDGFKAQVFHDLCDEQGPTLVVVKSTLNQIFGGYANKSWISSPSQTATKIIDTNSFLFQLTKKKKLPQKSGQNCAMMYQKGVGPSFGYNNDLSIWDDSDKNQSSHSYLGQAYECPQGENIQTFLAGTYTFSTLEVEVFKVV